MDTNIPRFTMTNLPENRVTDLQLKNWQYMITKPKLNEASEAFRRCGALTNSKDQPDAKLIYRSPPNGTIWPIASIRAFEFTSLYGLYLLNPDLQKDKQAVRVTACLGDEFFFASKKFSMVLQRNTEYILQRTEYRCSRCSKPHASRWRKPPANGKAINILTSGMLRDIEFPKKTAQVLRHKRGCHEEDDGACFWVEKKTHHQPIAKDEKYHPAQSVETTEENHRQRKVRNMMEPNAV